MLEWIIPDWPAPPNVQARVTTRLSGYSQWPYDSFNLADHVGDDPIAVAANRELLKQALQLPAEPLWLQQVHGVNIVDASVAPIGCIADASYTMQPANICTVMTADCLPVLFCDRDGTKIAVAHAGWRGLSAGILENTLNTLKLRPNNVLVWLGPAIAQQSFEVDREVCDTFVGFLPQAVAAFTPTRPNHWIADLYLLARQRLNHSGITAIYGGEHCTYTDVRRFYSYRRDKRTGRIASLIWLAQ
jgi:YfiH family protein